MMPHAYWAQGKRILVLGFGITGRAVCEFAHHHSHRVFVSEQGHLSDDQQDWLHAHSIEFEHTGHTTRFLPKADAVVLSPGIPCQHPVLGVARQRGLPVLSETEYALGFVPDCRVIAVTGTNGKSSTVEVLGTLLRALGQRPWVAGNIGIPLISVVDEIGRHDVIVLEMSSYQLEQSRGFRPQVGVLLNLEPDHLRRHGTMESYARAKGNLFLHQESSDVAIMPRALAPQFEYGLGRRVYYDEALNELPPSAHCLLPHEQLNLLAAIAACRALVPELDIASLPMDRVASTFRMPHRMETVGFVNDIQIINDSKSTNAASAIAALHAVDDPVVLLLGGRSKGAGYEALVSTISVANPRAVILFGEAADELKGLFHRSSALEYHLLITDSLHAAVTEAIRVAQAGDIVLLSPACSSFDAFADYVERGERFSAQIRALPGYRFDVTRT